MTYLGRLNMTSYIGILKRVVLLLALAVTAGSLSASATQLLTNGGFETGSFTGWTVTNQAGGSGSFYIDGTVLAPLSQNPAAGPAAGSSYAVSDQVGPSANVLIQTFVVPSAASSVILSFDMFVNDSSGSGPFIDPSGLDYSSGGTGSPNQHARVDILSAIATPFDTGAGVLDNLYIGVDPQHQNPNPYTQYTFDITSLVGAGGTFQIRFAEVGSLANLNQGVDNVSITFAAVPEPSAALLIGLGLVSLSRVSRRIG
jgi:hypothetical protein